MPGWTEPVQGSQAWGGREGNILGTLTLSSLW